MDFHIDFLRPTRLSQVVTGGAPNEGRFQDSKQYHHGSETVPAPVIVTTGTSLSPD